MSVVNGQIANQTTFNNAFMSRTAPTTQTTAQVALENAEPESGAFVENTQRAINKAFEGVGATGEADTTINDYASNNYISDGDNRKVAIEKLDTQLKTTQDEVDAAELRIDATEDRLDVIESQPSTFGGDKTFTDDVVIQGKLQVLGAATEILTSETVIEDPTITLNKNGLDLSAEGGGFEIERPSGNAGMIFDSTLASKFKIGLLSNLYEVIVSGVAQTIAGLKNFTSGIKTDVVDESTLNAGVTVETVLIKDGLVDGRDVSADGATLDGHTTILADHESRLDTIETLPSTFGGDKLFTDDVTIQQSLTVKDLIAQETVVVGSTANAQTGADQQLTGITAPLVKLTGAGLASINRIDAPTGSRIIALLNQTGADVIIKDNVGSPASARIRTGTGANATLANNQIAFLAYDSTTALWYLTSVGGAGASGGSGKKTFDMKLNGLYGGSAAYNGVDGLWVAPSNCQITNVFIYQENVGSGGTTTLDLKAKPFASGAFTSIFLTAPAITPAAGANSWCGVGDTVTGCTAPVLTTLPFAVAAKTALRLDLLGAQTGSAAGVGLIVVYEEI